MIINIRIQTKTRQNSKRYNTLKLQSGPELLAPFIKMNKKDGQKQINDSMEWIKITQFF